MNQPMTIPVEKEPIGEVPLTPKRWGFWATLGFGVVIIALYLFAQGLAVGVMAVIEAGGVGSIENKEELVASIVGNGFYLSVGIIVSACVGVLTIWAVVALRKNISLKEYLALKNPSLKVYARWVAIGLIFLFAWEGANAMLEQPDSAWVMETYETAKYVPLIWIAFVIAAPLFEEFFFRGFLFEGLRDSWMGPVGAVVVTSIAWASIHMQYGMFQIVMIGLLGVLLGIAKLKTRSLYVVIAMHSLNNLVATIQVSLYLNS